MPFAHKKLPNGKIEVFKADTGKKVGITTPGKLQGYLAALHINSPENKMNMGGECYAEGGEVVKDISKETMAKALAQKDIDYFEDRIKHHQEVNAHSKDPGQISDNLEDIHRMMKELSERKKILGE